MPTITQREVRQLLRTKMRHRKTNTGITVDKEYRLCSDVEDFQAYTLHAPIHWTLRSLDEVSI